jgi:hypothetical protein
MYEIYFEYLETDLPTSERVQRVINLLLTQDIETSGSGYRVDEKLSDVKYYIESYYTAEYVYNLFREIPNLKNLEFNHIE